MESEEEASEVFQRWIAANCPIDKTPTQFCKELIEQGDKVIQKCDEVIKEWESDVLI